MENRIEAAKMLIRFYNMQSGTSFRTGNESNQKVILEVLSAMDDNVIDVKNHIRAWTKDNAEQAKSYDGFRECMDAAITLANEKKKKAEEPAPAPVEVAAPVAPVMPAMTTDAQIGGALALIGETVSRIIAEAQAENIKAAIMDNVESKVRQFIKDEYGTIERKIVTVVDGKRVPMKGIQHDKFETVLKFVANDEPVFLTGPAGSGKNVLCKQVAEALGLKFYFTNAVTQEYKLTGFTDAMGTYQPTQFYKAFTEGGVFMLDEMDASIPEVLVILNAAIANRYFDFPAPIGYVEAHPDFRVIAAGNTTGHGADIEYVGRNQLDGASLDRFAVVRIDYSEAIENSVAMGDMELADFCRDFRRSALEAGLSIIVSYRAIGRLAKMVQLLSIEEALETCLVKGLDMDDVKIIEKGLNKNSKYRSALKNIARAA